MNVSYLTNIVSRIKYMFCGSYYRVSKKLTASRLGKVCTPEPYLVIPPGRVYVSLGSGELSELLRELLYFCTGNHIFWVNDVPLCCCPCVEAQKTNDQYCKVVKRDSHTVKLLICKIFRQAIPYFTSCDNTV